MLVVSAGTLSVFFELSTVLTVGQLLIIVPALLRIAIRRLLLQAIAAVIIVFLNRRQMFERGSGVMTVLCSEEKD